MKTNAVDALIKQYRLAKISGDIHQLAREAISLQSQVGGSNKPGSSRLGGMPELPAGTVWPAWQDQPMSFIAQVRLADVAAFSPAGDLPKDGLLSFFYNAQQDTYGASPSDRGSWQILYLAPGTVLQPRDFPPNLPENARFKPCTLSFTSILTLPVDPRQGLPGLNWSDDQVKAYEQMQNALPGPDQKKRPQHQMFGYPAQLQDDMPSQCALVTQGITSADDPRVAAALSHKEDWRLLLQVDSDDGAGMRWGSYGMLYYWLRIQDLQARKFDQAWLVQQSD
jgi:uncharacterized protein YwqG